MLKRSRRRVRRTAAGQSLEQRCLLATITVTTAADAVANDGQVSLREAVQAANTDTSVDGSTAGSGADQIVFDPAVTSPIVLVSGQLDVSDDLTITGPAGKLTIDAGGNSRILEVTGVGADLTVENLVLMNGVADQGGAILVGEDATLEGVVLTVRDSVLRNNSATSRGGAIAIDIDTLKSNTKSYLDIDNSVLATNTAATSGGGVFLDGWVDVSLSSSRLTGQEAGLGAAVHMQRQGVTGTFWIADTVFSGNRGGAVLYGGRGTVTIAASRFRNNSKGPAVELGVGQQSSTIRDSSFVGNTNPAAVGVGRGGAVRAWEVRIIRSEFLRNTAAESGGAIYARYLTVEESLIADNEARSGGGIYSFGSLLVSGSEIRGNTATYTGGGIHANANDTDRVTRVEDSLIVSNRTTGDDGRGGGMYSRFDTEVSRSSILDNSTSGSDAGGGGLFVRLDSTSGSELLLENSTISGNSTHGTNAKGGGLHVVLGAFVGSRKEASVEILNSTITRNTTGAISSPAGGVFAKVDLARNPSLTIASSIIADNDGVDLRDDLVTNGSLTTYAVSNSFIGNNEGSDLTETGLAAPDADGNYVGSADAPIDPQLQPLALFVTDLPVHAPASASPVVDKGSNPRHYTLDNRRSQRVTGSAADMGAFEGVSDAFLELNDVAVTEGDAGQTNADFTVTLRGNTPTDIVVAYETEDGSATLADSDYVQVSGGTTLAGTHGTSATISVPVTGDTHVERIEDFRLKLTSAASSVEVGVDWTAGSGVATIDADDFGGARLIDGDWVIRGTDGADSVVVETIEDNFRLTLNGSQSLIPVYLVDGVFIKGLAENDTVDLSDTAIPARVIGDEGNDTILGGSAADILSGSSGNDSIVAGDGHDIVRGGAGDDVLNGGDGFDSLYGGNGGDTLDGGLAADTLEGGHGNDHLSGGSGSDWISAGPDHDTVLGGNGNDTMLGEGGDDSLSGSRGVDRIDGGHGNDTLAGGGSRDILDGRDGDDRILGGSGDDTAHGHAGNDTIDGGAGDDRLHGDSGMDRLIGRAGVDHLFGGSEADRLLGQEHDDVLWGEEGDDTLVGGSGSDQMYGQAGNDKLLGGDGDELIMDGGEGHDRLEGGDGRDYMIGGVGTDTLLGQNGDDILIAGTTETLFHLLSPYAIRAEWTSARSYDQRMKNVRGTAGKSADRANGNHYLRPTSHKKATVFEDGDAGDLLRGNAGEDLFFAHKTGSDLDRVYRDPGEFLARI